MFTFLLFLLLILDIAWTNIIRSFVNPSKLRPLTSLAIIYIAYFSYSKEPRLVFRLYYRKSQLTVCIKISWNGELPAPSAHLPPPPPPPPSPRIRINQNTRNFGCRSCRQLPAMTTVILSPNNTFSLSLVTSICQHDSKIILLGAKLNLDILRPQALQSVVTLDVMNGLIKVGVFSHSRCGQQADKSKVWHISNWIPSCCRFITRPEL
jgi:hypothetical protein